jgi:hypothetical protein
MSDSATPRCSFCGKTQDEVRTLVAGSKVWICDECIDLCNDIVFARSPSVVRPLRMAWRALWWRITKWAAPSRPKSATSNQDTTRAAS